MRRKRLRWGVCVPVVGGIWAFGVLAGDATVKTAEAWKKEAEGHLRAGEKRLAAEAFEQVAARDVLAKQQLAPVLVRLYAEAHMSAQALGWAKVAGAVSPDPPAYLADVHFKLGQVLRAKAILSSELAKSNAPARIVSLSGQLAELQVRQGQTNDALATLERASKSVRGTPESEQAEKQMATLRGRFSK